MLIFGVALLALMSGALFYAARIPVEAPATPPPQPTQVAMVTHPAFVLPDMDGVEREFAEWDGKHRLLNFWATWCAPCRREIPLLKTFQDEYGDAGFQVLGIAVDYPEQVTLYAEEAGFNYPVLVGQQEAMAVAELSGIEFIGMPFTMFVTKDGEYVGAYIGELHESHLNDVVNIFERLDKGEITGKEARGAFRLL
jgi:thiol-disulfide isomerase/thioredoxin